MLRRRTASKSEIVMYGRSDVHRLLPQYFFDDDYFRFLYMCRYKKNLIDAVWLKKFLLENRKNIGHNRYFRIYQQFFEPVTRRNRIYRPVNAFQNAENESSSK